MTFVPVFGTQFDSSTLRNSTLVLPSQCVGLSAHIGMELFIINNGMQKVGYYKTEYLAPVVVNDCVTLSG